MKRLLLTAASVAALTLGGAAMAQTSSGTPGTDTGSGSKSGTNSMSGTTGSMAKPDCTPNRKPTSNFGLSSRGSSTSNPNDCAPGASDGSSGSSTAPSTSGPGNRSGNGSGNSR